MKALEQRARSGFERAFGGPPELLAAAPGRVNLIGEHTDYNDGWVLPAAISVGTIVAARPRADARIRAAALDFDAVCDFPIDAPITRALPGDWSNYLRGVAAVLQAQGADLRGADLAIAGNIPTGAGLSSSASLEVALGLALTELAGLNGYDRTQLALAGQRAEHDFAGCQCGIMDQLVSARAAAGNALLIDCRSLATMSVLMAPETAVLIVHSGIRRELVEGEYNTRRRQCEEAARRLGVPALRDASTEELDAAGDRLDPVVFRRARHVITENARTLAAADALTEGNLATLGALMAASHTSMRDDFEITTPAIDALVGQLSELIGDRGGVRMTGGGFGGAVVAIAARNVIEEAAQAIGNSYRTPDGDPPVVMIEEPAGGARLL
ncbi:galactokinase [Sphingomonas sp. GlSt437]|uniref:galactokinase n=1 Tax=Sphingomonas sp. GlSt437 TaxID=3389970 RepID=UPI003A8B8200